MPRETGRRPRSTGARCSRYTIMAHRKSAIAVHPLMETVMRRTSTLAIAVSGFVLAAPATGAQQQREPYPGFDAYIRASLATWKVPGLSIAIVRNDSII